ncbi:MAG: AmmeMemoRadiSam system protein B [Acidobacteriota bacterium]|nr:AmmeMemoRadiSam system protein B [Acidobacteriota bacterium]
MTARRVRPPAVAGTFYPAWPSELVRHIDALLAAAGTFPDGPLPRALVVPHAGTVYSGPVAATAYARLRPHAASIARVVAFGPVHRVAMRGAAVPAADAWATPLGEVPIDAGLRTRAVARGAAVDDRPHAPEHALEVQLPFLQRVLGAGFTFLPVAVSELSAGAASDLIDEFLGEAGTLVLVSTDLSHYHDLATARRLDRRTADKIVACESEKLSGDDACGFYPLRGLMELAGRKKLPIELLDLRTSGDTAGDPESVVGYGAFDVRPRLTNPF